MALAEEAADRIGALLDRVMTLDIKGRGAAGLLYGAVRSDGAPPLSIAAARTIRDSVGAGDSVILSTGFPVRPWIDPGIGETDGPPGIAAMARALSMGLGAVPLVTVPPAMRGQAEAALRAGGVMVLTPDEVSRAVAGPRPTCAAAILDYTIEDREAEAMAEAVLARHRPVLVLAIEHPGANAAGRYHSSVGVDISDGVARLEPLFARARTGGVPTLSFIDNANEIGAGAVQAVAHAHIAFAEKCVCPCGQGMAASSRVDQLVVATTTNWAAYATVAALAVLLGKPELVVTRERDAAAIAAVMTSGGVEGVTGSILPEAGLDGVSTRISGHMVDLIAEIAAHADHYAAAKPF